MDAPTAGQEVTLRGVVLTSHTHTDNKFYGTGYAQVRVRLEDGPAGFAYADLRLVVDDTGKWFGPRAKAAASELAAEPTDSMTKAELLALADARGLDVPNKATKAELVELLTS